MGALVMPMLRRQKALLALIVAFATLLVLIGTWETVMLGAPHQLVLGVLILATTALAFHLAKRKRASAAEPGEEATSDQTLIR
jgi:hypothetical protein